VWNAVFGWAAGVAWDASERTYLQREGRGFGDWGGKIGEEKDGGNKGGKRRRGRDDGTKSRVKGVVYVLVV